MNIKDKKFLPETHPAVAVQWDFENNDGKTPDQFTAGSNKRVNWICDKGHRYLTKICHRTYYDSGCPYCSGKKLVKERSFGFKFPKLAEEFDLIKNVPHTPDTIFSSSQNKYYWTCVIDSTHSWESTTDNRIKGNGCPICVNRGDKIIKEKSFGGLFPNLVEEWDQELNLKTPYDYAPFSNKSVFWICKINKQHKWSVVISHRSNGTGCPFCSGNKVSESYNLLVSYPEVAAELHPSMNGLLLAKDVSPGSANPLYWQCQKDLTHVWKASPYNRTKRNAGCSHCISGWTVEKIRAFILSLLPYVQTLGPAECYKLLRHTGVLKAQGKSESFIKNFIAGKIPFEELELAVNDPVKFDELITNSQNTTIDDPDNLKVISELDVATSAKNLPIVETKDILASLSGQSKFLASADAETIDFFIKSQAGKIWCHAFYDEKKALEQLDQYASEEEYPKQVTKMFSEAYRGAKSLEIPAGYSRTDYQPNLMQRYIADQIKAKKRFGNWSGTGAGKTLSAILASRVIEAKLTVILCPNNVIETWKEDIQAAYPDSMIYTHESLVHMPKNVLHAYLIMNYDFFQQRNSEEKVKQLVDRYSIDFIVIDEIHYTKQRHEKITSKRKRVIWSFLSTLSQRNLNLSVLGMSATPVINNLLEGRTLIELITGEIHDDLDTKATFSNCVDLYAKFVRYGIRYMPNYDIQFNLTLEPVDCSAFLLEIRKGMPVIELEAVLTKAKLPFILKNLKRRPSFIRIIELVG
ncbi:MAG: zinc-ribbon domain-containing protein [Candidatus Babeliales bacterium]|jgi:hypothetical protein